MGTDKATLPFHDASLLEHAIAVLASFASPIVVVRAADQRSVSLPTHVREAIDARPDRGPLEGLRAGLAAIAPADVAFVVAVDLPFLSTEFARRMVALLGDHDAAVPRTKDGAHPLAACYRARVLPVIESLLAENRLAMHELLTRIDCRFVDVASHSDLRALMNVNTPEDYARAVAVTRTENS